MTKSRSILYTVLALSTLIALPAVSLAALPKRKAYRPDASSQSSGTPATPPPAQGESFWVTGAFLVAIQTDEVGKVDTIAVRKGDTLNTYSGCGLALANVPHLVDALKDKRRFSARIDNGCVRRISVGNE